MVVFWSVFLCCESSDFGGTSLCNGVFREPAPQTLAKSQDDARRERLDASARAPGRPVLPFGDVEGWNLRTRNGAVYYWDILTLSTTSRQSYRGAASRRPYGRSVRRELPTQQRLWWV